MNILIVDDDALTLEAIQYRLKDQGYSVATAEDGVKALEIIEKQDLNLIICDIMMPNMSGLGLLSLLKQFYFNKIPVILISSLDKSDIILSSLSLGAQVFIAKPLNYDELLIRVKKFALN